MTFAAIRNTRTGKVYIDRVGIIRQFEAVEAKSESLKDLQSKYPDAHLCCNEDGTARDLKPRLINQAD